MNREELLDKIRSVNERLDTVEANQRADRRTVSGLKNELLACYKEAVNMKVKKHGVKQ